MTRYHLLLPAFLSSCPRLSPCEEACHRIYATEDSFVGENACGIRKVGLSSEEDEIEDCEEQCLEAWKNRDGDAEDYHPKEYTPANESESTTLDNRAEVELWAECIEDTRCNLINNGYCAPLL